MRKMEKAPAPQKSNLRIMWVEIASVFVIVATAVTLYWPSTEFGLTLDDVPVTQSAELGGNTAAGVLGFFSDHLYAGTDLERGNANLYRPFLLLSLAFSSGSPAARTRHHHYVNVALYALCSVFVLGLMKRLTLRFLEADSRPVAFWTALVFVVLPSHLEAVCNIKHREEILACLFALVCWILFLDENGKLKTNLGPRSWLGALALLAALLSKESAILIIPCMLLCEWINPRENRPFQVPQSMSAIATSVGVYTLLRIHALGTLLSPDGTYHFFVNESVMERTTSAARLFWIYSVWDQIVGLQLNPAFSSRIPILRQQNMAIDGLALAAILIGTVYLYIAAVRRKSLIAIGLSFFLITSALMFQLVPTGTAGAFRLQFMPSVFLCLSIVAAAFQIGRTQLHRFGKPIWAGAVAHLLLTLCTVIYAFVTIQRMPIWKDNKSLFTYVSMIAPDDPIAHGAVGQLAGNEQSPALKLAHYQRALDIYMSPSVTENFFDARNRDLFAVVATEVAFSHLEHAPAEALRLANLAVVQFRGLALLTGSVDENITAPFYVMAQANLKMANHEHARRACLEGLEFARHQGLELTLKDIEVLETGAKQ